MDKQVLINGMQWGKIEPIVPPLNYEDFVNELVSSLGMSKENFRPEAAFAGQAMVAKATFGFAFHSPDLCNPLEVGWALLLPPRSRETEAIEAALKPLVLHRKGQVIYSPIPFDSCPPDAWIRDKYNQMDSRPYYVLLAGSVQDIPFRFQYNFDVSAAVGRLSLNTIEDYSAYAIKVVEFETRDKLSVARRAVVFATEHPSSQDGGATYLSRYFMAEPLADMITKKGIPVTKLLGIDNNDNQKPANLNNLKEALQETQGLFPALVYTATHGLGVPGYGKEDEEIRRRMQGALVCQDYDGQDGVFSEDHVPNGSFLHGSIVCTFACYSAGTPARSDFFHWLHDPRLLTCRPIKDFVAALPIRMLAHPQGPLAYLGHIDPSFGLSFTGPDQNIGNRSWGSRMGPFRDAVKLLLDGATIGYAADSINATYSQLSVSLANDEDDFRANPNKAHESPWRGELVNKWIARNDMQNFVVLGDPAVKAKMKLDASVT
jgi:hypothetical protein